MAVNKEGTWMSNVGPGEVNAVTWGVFPAREIIQPTVVDPSSFMVWKDEAFEIWSRGWALLYPEDDPSRKLLEEVGSRVFSYSFYTLYSLVSLPRMEFSNGEQYGTLVILQVQNSHFLVSLVDNDYINGDLFAIFMEF